MYFIIELLSSLFVYGIRLERREKFKSRFFYSSSVVIILTIGMGKAEAIALNGAQNTMDAYLGFGSMLGLIFVALVSIVLVLCKVSIQEAVYCTTCAYLTEHMAYCIRIIVNEMAGGDIAKTGTLLYFMIHVGVYLAAYYLVVKKMLKEKHYLTSAVQSLSLMIAVLFLVAGMSCTATIYRFEFIHAIYALFCCAFVLYSQEKYQKQMKLRGELNVQKQLWIHHKTQYEMSKENIDIINRKCHDLKYQILALKNMDSIEQKQAIDSIEASIMIYDAMPKTGNAILDTVLAEKSLICNQKNIKLSCIADGKLLDFIEVIDLYTFFGNAIDNAMESVMELEEEERYITLLIHKKADLIFIQIENAYLGSIKMEEGIPLTSKKNCDFHGFGIKSMLRIAEKYQGFMTIETANHIFLLRITIPPILQVRT